MDAETEVAGLSSAASSDQDDGCGVLKAIRGKRTNSDSEQLPDECEEEPNRKCAVVDVPINFIVYQKYGPTPNDELSQTLFDEAQLPAVDSQFVYAMDKPKRGKMIIISNQYFLEGSGMEDMPRNGTKFDAENLRSTFHLLQFECEIHENKTCAEMLFIIISASNSQDFDCDCMAFAFLTYGGTGNKIYGTDGCMPISSLLGPLKHGHNMAKFAGKPKLFFFQVCQGQRHDEGMDVTDAGGDVNMFNVRKIPLEADFLYSYASAPDKYPGMKLFAKYVEAAVQQSENELGYYAFDGIRGSVYIRVLCEMLNKLHETTDLLTILTRVNHHVAYEFESQVKSSNPLYEVLNQKKQMPTIVSMLTKDLYLSNKR